MRRMAPLLTAALLALLLAGCGSSTNNEHTNSPSTIPETSPSSSEQSQPTATNSSEPTAAPSKDNTDQPTDHAEAAVKDAAENIVELLRDRDLASLSDWIDPEQGLRFSPYSHIDIENSKVFKPGELPDFKDANPLTWGTADGSGEPLELTFRDYYDRFIYSQDFAEAPNVTVNNTLAQGTTTFNGTEVYPGASYVEFYFPGFDEKFEGMDWQSLVLVFIPSGDDWKLVSIVHGQWTT